MGIIIGYESLRIKLLAEFVKMFKKSSFIKKVKA